MNNFSPPASSVFEGGVPREIASAAAISASKLTNNFPRSHARELAGSFFGSSPKIEDGFYSFESQLDLPT
jgi:hypothetical protein